LLKSNNQIKEFSMRNLIFTSALASGVLFSISAMAEPGGCLKYGAGGAVAGHFAHHHAVLGAIAGCGTGMVVRHEHRKHLREQKRQLENSQNN
jgi:hypothetical protein